MRFNGAQNVCFNYIKGVADQYVDGFTSAGHAPAGCNGPYGDNDTPIRNTAHWCVTYAFLYKATGNEKYKTTVEAMSRYLMDDRHYGKSGAAICRTQHHNDDTNGVVGQAWLIEGLIACYEVTGNATLIDEAVDVWKVQKYHDAAGCFGIICSDGKEPCMDITFNHNLWFAASGAMLLTVRENDYIRKAVSAFVKRIPSVLGVQSSGKLYHRNNYREDIKGKIRFALDVYQTDRNMGNSKNLNYLESGYQLFDLFGFALLKQYWNGEDSLYSSKGLTKAVRLGTDVKFIDSLKDGMPEINKYAFPYNSPAYEYPYVAEVLGEGCDKHEVEKLLNFQSDLMRNHKELIADENTLYARVYELVRYCAYSCDA